MYGLFAKNILGDFFDGSFFTSFFDFVILGILVVMLAAFVIITVILNHHWKSYGIEAGQIKKLQILYFGGSGILISLMLGSFLAWFF